MAISVCAVNGNPNPDEGKPVGTNQGVIQSGSKIQLLNNIYYFLVSCRYVEIPSSIWVFWRIDPEADWRLNSNKPGQFLPENSVILKLECGPPFTLNLLAESRIERPYECMQFQEAGSIA
jgi:hypothetical protein